MNSAAAGVVNGDGSAASDSAVTLEDALARQPVCILT